jgi:hypothetical protein
MSKVILLSDGERLALSRQLKWGQLIRSRELSGSMLQSLQSRGLIMPMSAGSSMFVLTPEGRRAVAQT